MSFYPSSNTPTRSIETETSYLNTFRQLRNRCAREHGYGTAEADNVTPEVLCIWLLGRVHEFSKSTWHQYKAATLFSIQKNYSEYTEVISQLQFQKSSELPAMSKRTSGRKLKCVPPEFWENFRSVLQIRARKHRYSMTLLNFLHATIITGLRPNEWFNSIISRHTKTGKLVLKVKNSKNSNWRANGGFREIFISELLHDDLEAIKITIAYCSAQQKNIKSSLTSLQNEFFNARKQLCEEKAITNCKVAMYSFRHQFFANIKKIRMQGPCIAALGGHNSVHTSTKHYGKKHSGNLGPSVMPTPESIDAVCNHGAGRRNVAISTEISPTTENASGNKPEI